MLILFINRNTNGSFIKIDKQYLKSLSSIEKIKDSNTNMTKYIHIVNNQFKIFNGL